MGDEKALDEAKSPKSPKATLSAFRLQVPAIAIFEFLISGQSALRTNQGLLYLSTMHAAMRLQNLCWHVKSNRGELLVHCSAVVL